MSKTKTVSPLFSSQTDKEGEPIYAEDIREVRIYRVVPPAPGKTGIERRALKASEVKLDIDPYSTTEGEIGDAYGAGVYYLEPVASKEFGKVIEGRVMPGGHNFTVGEAEEDDEDDDDDDDENNEAEELRRLREENDRLKASSTSESSVTKLLIEQMKEEAAANRRAIETRAEREAQQPVNAIDMATKLVGAMTGGGASSKRDGDEVAELRKDHREEIRELRSRYDADITSRNKQISNLEDDLRSLRKEADTRERALNDKMMELREKLLEAKVDLRIAESEVVEDVPEKSEGGIPGFEWAKPLLEKLPDILKHLTSTGYPIPQEVQPHLQKMGINPQQPMYQPQPMQQPMQQQQQMYTNGPAPGVFYHQQYPGQPPPGYVQQPPPGYIAQEQARYVPPVPQPQPAPVEQVQKSKIDPQRDLADEDAAAE